ncbi:MAG: hypothetical protein ABFR47_05860 [Verrucomicrobiota bacterium]
MNDQTILDVLDGERLDAEYQVNTNVYKTVNTRRTEMTRKVASQMLDTSTTVNEMWRLAVARTPPVEWPRRKRSAVAERH